MPWIVLMRKEHNVFSKAWIDAIPKGEGTNIASPQQILDRAREIYGDNHEILDVIEEFF